MDRMVPHGKIPDADAHPLSQACNQRVDAREHPAVERPHVEIDHDRWIRCGRPGVHREAVQHDGVVAVDPGRLRLLRMDDEHPHHAHGELHHFVAVRVVHEGAVLPEGELVDVGLAGLDLRLRQPAHAVHAVGQKDAVPVDAGVLPKPVGHIDAHAVAFHALDGRAGRLPVVAPAVDYHAGRELALHRFGDEMEHFDVTVHLPRQRAAIEGDHRRVVLARRRGDRRSGSGRRVFLGRGGAQRSRDRAARQQCSARLEQVSTIHCMSPC
jgi:hypothetical protein